MVCNLQLNQYIISISEVRISSYILGNGSNKTLTSASELNTAELIEVTWLERLACWALELPSCFHRSKTAPAETIESLI